MAPCSIKCCGKDSKTSNYKIDGLTFHRYPKDADVKEKWINATRRESWTPSENSVICSRHFTQDCFKQMKNNQRLISSAVPSLLLPLSDDSESMESTLAKPDLMTTVPEISFNPATSTPEHKNKRGLIIRYSSIHPLILSNLSSISYIPPSISVTSKRKLICGSPSQYNNPNKKRFSRRLIELSGKIFEKNRQIKNLRQKTVYLKRKISSLKEEIKELEEISVAHSRERRHSQ